MNILFLTPRYKPDVGGVEKHVEEISKVLSKDHHIVIITESHDPKLKNYEKYPESEVHRIPLSGIGEWSKKFFIWEWLFKHLDLIKTADVIHVHDVFYWYLPFKLFFPIIKVFITFHGYEGSDPPGIIQIFWHRLAANLCLGNICIGDFHRSWYGIVPNIVSYGAVNSPPINKDRQPKAVFIGRLSEDTGIMDYLKGIKKNPIPVDVYGSGPQEDVARKYAKSHNLPATFHGFVPRASEFIGNYKIAFISRYLGILEALASQTPVIAHYDNQIKHDYLSLAPFAKYISIVSNPDEISIAVKRLLNLNQPLKNRTIQGYNWAIKQTWEKLAEEYQTLWRIKSP